jgi:hypothetical protein
MSKMRHVPIDDALRQFRFNALNTPLVAKDMTTLDKEMSDILSRTDLSKENKLKKYYEALGKFQEARDIFKNASITAANTPNPTQIKEMEKIIKNDGEIKNDDIQQPSMGVNSLLGDAFATANSILDDGNAQFSTPTPTSTSTPSTSHPTNVSTPINREQSKERKRMNKEWDKIKMKEQFLKTMNIKNQSLRIPSPSRGGALKTIGNVDQLDPIFDYLFSQNEEANSPRFAAGRRNNILMQNVVHFLKQNPIRNLEKKYPILREKFGNITGSGQARQKGFGKVKINYKQWDYLNKKLNL